VFLVAMMGFAVRLNVIGEDVEPNSSISQIVRHLEADAAFIPPLVQQVNCIAFAPNFFAPQLAISVTVPYPPDN